MGNIHVELSKLSHCFRRRCRLKKRFMDRLIDNARGTRDDNRSQ